MGSTRLPGKVLRPLAGKEVLWHVVTRVRVCTNIAKVIVATSTSAIDDVLVSYCEEAGFEVRRGSETDVLLRFFEVASEFPDHDIVRITADCPLVDPALLSDMTNAFRASPCDYFSNCHPVRTFAKGFDIEIVRSSALRQACAEAADPYEREHVTPYFYRHPEKFSLGLLRAPVDRSQIRVTLDTEEDYQLLSRVFEDFARGGKTPDAESVLDYLAQHSETVEA